MAQKAGTLARKAGIYARISDDRVGDAAGVNRQLTDCRALCAARGWHVADEFVDNDIGAYRGRLRPEFERLRTMLKDGDLEHLVVWHPDRLTRQPRELEDLIALLDASGVQVATVTAGEYDLSSATGRMTARIVGAVARQESEHKSERIIRKAQELAELGKPNGGTRPFGYSAGGLEVDPTEAARLQEAARRVLAGESLRGIARDWNERQVVTTAGGVWTPGTLKRVLLRPRNAALREYRSSTDRARGAKPEIIGPAVWPAVLDRETWERLCAVLNDPARRKFDPGRARKYLLTGLARCGLCGGKLVARPRADKRRCYVCASGPGFGGCGKIRSLSEPLEELIVEATLQRLDGPALARQMTDARKAAGPDVVAEVERLERRLEQVADDYAADRVTRAQFLKINERLRADLDMSRKAFASDRRTTTLDQFVGDEGALRRAWPDLPLDRRRAVLDALVSSVVVGPAVRGRNFFDPTRIDIEWRV